MSHTTVIAVHCVIATFSYGSCSRFSASASEPRSCPRQLMQLLSLGGSWQSSQQAIYDLKESGSRYSEGNLFMYMICPADFSSILFCCFSSSKQTSWVACEGIFAIFTCTTRRLCLTPLRRLSLHWGAWGQSFRGTYIWECEEDNGLSSRFIFCFSLFLPSRDPYFIVMAMMDGGWVCSCSGSSSLFLGGREVSRYQKVPLLM